MFATYNSTFLLCAVNICFIKNVGEMWFAFFTILFFHVVFIYVLNYLKYM